MRSRRCPNYAIDTTLLLLLLLLLLVVVVVVVRAWIQRISLNSTEAVSS